VSTRFPSPKPSATAAAPPGARPRSPRSSGAPIFRDRPAGLPSTLWCWASAAMGISCRSSPAHQRSTRAILRSRSPRRPISSRTWSGSRSILRSSRPPGRCWSSWREQTRPTSSRRSSERTSSRGAGRRSSPGGRGRPGSSMRVRRARCPGGDAMSASRSVSDVAPTSVVTSGDGTPIAVFSSGDGRPLVLVHGSTADHTTFRVVGPRLAERFRVHAMDRRGRGGSGDAPAYAIEREFEDVAAVVAAVSAGSRSSVAVFGHSYGGRCALGAALLTDAIDRVVSYEGAPTPAGASYHPAGIETRLREQLAAGDRDGALAIFLAEVVGMSADDLVAYRANPVWPLRAAAAGTILREL